MRVLGKFNPVVYVCMCSVHNDVVMIWEHNNSNNTLAK